MGRIRHSTTGLNTGGPCGTTTWAPAGGGPLGKDMWGGVNATMRLDSPQNFSISFSFLWLGEWEGDVGPACAVVGRVEDGGPRLVGLLGWLGLHHVGDRSFARLCPALPVASYLRIKRVRSINFYRSSSSSSSSSMLYWEKNSQLMYYTMHALHCCSGFNFISQQMICWVCGGGRYMQKEIGEKIGREIRRGSNHMK